MYSILHHDAKCWYGSLSLLPCEEHLKIFDLFIDYSRKQMDPFKLCDHLACDLLFICHFLLCISVGVLRCGSVCSCLCGFVYTTIRCFLKSPPQGNFLTTNTTDIHQHGTTNVLYPRLISFGLPGWLKVAWLSTQVSVKVVQKDSSVYSKLGSVRPNYSVR